MLINKDSAIGYTYVAFSMDTNKVINISKEHISIDNILKEDAEFYDEDYIPTSRELNFDMQYLDDLFENIIGHTNYSLIVRFNKKKEITFTYRTKADDIYIESDVSLDFPAPLAEESVNKIYQICLEVKNFTFSI